MASEGAFLDSTAAPPSEGEIAAAVGPTWPLWQRLQAWVGATYGVSGEPLFTGREHGWALRFRRSGKALLTLAPRAEGGFRALVVIGPSHWDAVEALPLTPRVRATWTQAKPYPDGRWIFTEVPDGATVRDLEQLIALKSPPPKRLRARAAAAAPA